MQKDKFEVYVKLVSLQKIEPADLQQESDLWVAVQQEEGPHSHWIVADLLGNHHHQAGMQLSNRIVSQAIKH